MCVVVGVHVCARVCACMCVCVCFMCLGACVRVRVFACMFMCSCLCERLSAWSGVGEATDDAVAVLSRSVCSLTPSGCLCSFFTAILIDRLFSDGMFVTSASSNAYVLSWCTAHTPSGFLAGLCCKGVIDGWVKVWGDVSTDGLAVRDQCLR